jgi:hypothetical protein
MLPEFCAHLLRNESKMTKCIVITSIHHPTEAVEKFSQQPDFKLIVVGDSKTPKNWNCKNVIYLSLDYQRECEFDLLKTLPINHYSRKMIGYLIAMKDAQIIIDTDDDNIPKNNWEFPASNLSYQSLDGQGFVNIYQWYTEQKIWPRGLPLDLIKKEFHNPYGPEIQGSAVGVWQGLADKDPDVDAIYRLTIDEPCIFMHDMPLILKKGLISPFNSQNTLFYRALFLLMYLPVSVTFRFTDILRGLVAQPIMWAHDYHLGFTGASVVQKRNEHELMSDFRSEIPMYEHCEKVVDLVSACVSMNNSLEANLFNAYEKLALHNIVGYEEMVAVEAWINDSLKQMKIR